MEEELNEHELEERLYAMLHHVDETQNNINDSQKNKSDAFQLVDNGPRSTLRRYWRTGPENNPNPYHKSNIVKDSTSASVKIPAPVQNAPKEEKSPPKPPSPVDLSIFQSPVPQNIKKTIEFLDHEEDKPVVLESSDEDEVVEVALPPKPTITIESSDEEDLHIIEKSPVKVDPKSIIAGDRAVSASPVPSVVSSVSDEFIRGDCIALNISSRRPDKHSFDFSLHGSDLLGQNTNSTSKKRKRKKNKEAVTSTPIAHPENPANGDACFATPKSKAKNKKQKTKLFADKSEPRIMVYDSDSNMSSGDSNKNKNPYVVTEKSLPSVDVYESDSNQSEIVKEVNTDQSKDKYVIEDDSSDGNDNTLRETPKSSKKSISLPDSSDDTINLEDYDNYIAINDTGIGDNIVMGNVTGFNESSDYGEEDLALSSKGDISKYVSSKIPSILNEDLDFDNLKGKEKICKKRRYSLTTLRAEMEKFYNESWGGEDFNHKEIQKYMSRDKSLWAIDPKDRMQSFAQRKSKCNYCNRVGHRDDTCRQKPPVCYMCGNAGHFEPRCPTKICVNCGSPNFMYSTMCRNCSGWGHMRCGECGQSGHPASHCPDLWRRYHNTIDIVPSLVKCTKTKGSQQLYCSGCTQRGHLVDICRVTLPFSGLPLNTPYVKKYEPIYTQNSSTPDQNNGVSEDTTQNPDENIINKRLSETPTVHETHLNKKLNVSTDETANLSSVAAQKKDTKKVDSDNESKRESVDVANVSSTVQASISVPPKSSNHDNKGTVIQDDEVSNTSDAVTKTRIQGVSGIIDELKTKKGKHWLKAMKSLLNVSVAISDADSMKIKGKLVDLEVFQSELNEWVQETINNSQNSTEHYQLDEAEIFKILPENKLELLKLIEDDIESLNNDLGDPRTLYKKIIYSKNEHKKLTKMKVIDLEKIASSQLNLDCMFKNLNLILVGQAGLADRAEYLMELNMLKDILKKSPQQPQRRRNKRRRQKCIPDTNTSPSLISSPSFRMDIAKYHTRLFSTKPRKDYVDLLWKYYADKNNRNFVAKPNVKAREKKRKVVPNDAELKNMKTDSRHSHDVPPINSNTSIPVNTHSPAVDELPSHLMELNVLKDILTKSPQQPQRRRNKRRRQKCIPDTNTSPSLISFPFFRTGIAKYHTRIFPTNPHKDYVEFLKKYYADINNRYYVAKPKVKTRKKKRKVVPIVAESTNTKTDSRYSHDIPPINSNTSIPVNTYSPAVDELPSQEKSATEQNNLDIPFFNPNITFNGLAYKAPNNGYENQLPKLISFHDRLQEIKSSVTIKYKTQLRLLLSQLNTYITMILQSEKIPSKEAFPIRKLQINVEVFLKNVEYSYSEWRQSKALVESCSVLDSYLCDFNETNEC